MITHSYPWLNYCTFCNFVMVDISAVYSCQNTGYVIIIIVSIILFAVCVAEALKLV